MKSSRKFVKTKETFHGWRKEEGVKQDEVDMTTERERERDKPYI